MLNTYLKKIQVLFLLCITVLLSTVTIGSFTLRGSGVLQDEFWRLKRMSLTSLFYRVVSAKGAEITVRNGSGAQTVPVLVYHGIISDGLTSIDSPDGVNVTMSNFKSQMYTLKEHGWQTVSLNDYNAFLKGTLSLPDRSFVLSFDDGAKSSFYPVDPILDALDFRAVTFIITRYSIGIGSGWYVNSRELSYMRNTGRWDIESHGKEDHTYYPIDDKGGQGHFLSNRFWLENEHRMETDEEYRKRILTDLQTSKHDIEAELGTTVTGFAYPFGDYGQLESNASHSQDAILSQASSVYSHSFYQIWGSEYTQSAFGSNTFLVGRIEVQPAWTAQFLLSTLENGSAKSGRFLDALHVNNGWLNGWGFSEVNGGLHLKAEHTGTGAMSILDGSQLWSDYSVSVTATHSGDFSIIGRYKNIKNYIVCNFTENYVQLAEMIDGVTAVKSGRVPLRVRPQTYGISVDGTSASCYADGKVIVAGSALSEKLRRGGIGFVVYNPVVSTAEARISDLIVDEIHH